MRRLSLLALLLVAGSASAQVGRYTVDGTNPGGVGHYGGTLTVSPQGDALRVVWETGNAPVEGIGVVVNGVLAVAYGGACGVVAYATADTERTGTFEAVWAAMGGTQLGTEIARIDDETGLYRVAGTNPGSAVVYQGTLEMAGGDPATTVHWTVDGGSDYDGIGLLVDGVLGIAYGAPTCSVAVYGMNDGVLDGTWVSPGAAGVGTEMARP